MSRQLLYRDIRARDNLELFLVAAISSLLILRFSLYLSGYPQVGGGSLHIAHMLYGGLLMLIAIVILVSFIGARIQRLASLLGGIGFGIFIDELGKFITKDNNYFFRPTVGIIYAIFIALYLLFNFLSRSQKLTSREYQLNALVQFEEAVVQDLDPIEKRRLIELLKSADSHSPITQALQQLLKQIDTIPPSPPNIVQRVLGKADQLYQRFWHYRQSSTIIGVIFIIEAATFLVFVLGTIFHNISAISALFHGSTMYGDKLLVGQLLASLLAAGFALYGTFKLPRSRLEGFEQFKRATLINLFLTEFFIFSRIQFGAMTGFLVNLGLLLALRYSIAQEKRSLLTPIKPSSR